MAKFIQFSKTYNSNKFFNVDAIVKIEKWHSDQTNHEERLTIFINGEEPFHIAPTHPHWHYLYDLLEDLPE